MAGYEVIESKARVSGRFVDAVDVAVFESPRTERLHQTCKHNLPKDLIEVNHDRDEHDAVAESKVEEDIGSQKISSHVSVVVAHYPVQSEV